ncbi:HAD family hydrolase [Frigidibacter sp. MR17.14]|uniref:HAD family hydrolase n=1 Tax=Frigidibacter sp. MR17.14 TaxID=3126509 RepID=UPI0030131BA6
MNPLEIALSTGALVFGVAVSAGCFLSIRRMRDPEPDIEAADRFIARAPQPGLLPLSREVLADVRVVAFDAFGTLVRIDEPRGPWMKIIRQAARRRDPRLAAGTIRAFAEECGAHWDPEWEEDLQAELGSIRIFDDTLRVIDQLREAGYRLALISNLARPYVEPLREVFGQRFDAEIFSCDLQAVKPQPVMFASVCAKLDVAPSEVLMVGDSLRSDVDGARRFGMAALHLRRARREVAGTISTLDRLADQLKAARL